ncbi:MAG: Gfo/Idh/MocA family oxidoreductase [Thermoproteaceae archaeon]|nr:Gfo/Idh/MocA family oxidoreductase [Thermoproteaceae archaeon]
MVKVRVGIAGCGRIAGSHVRAWRRAGAEVVAVCDVVESKAREFARMHGVRQYFKSVREMLDGAELDILSVCTPPQAHKQVALEAIERGVNVFIEKPLVTSYSDAVEIVERARSRGVKLGVTTNYLFTPVMAKVRDLVRAGAIGAVRRVDVIVYVPEDVILSAGGGWLESLPGGALGEVLPHPIYLLQSLLGRLEPLSVSSAKISKSGWQRHDELHALLRGERGLGRVVISYNARHFDIYVIIEGTSGFILANPLGKALLKLGPRWRYWRNLFSFRHYAVLWLDYLLGRVPRDTLAENVRAFMKCVKGISPCTLNYDEILNQVEVYEKILKSLTP